MKLREVAGETVDYQLLEKVLVKHARNNEKQWHLCREAATWASETSSMIRAMMRDVSQSLLKLKKREAMGRQKNAPPGL
eukprot:2050886-Pyramimonas_sp.AAC.1